MRHNSIILVLIIALASAFCGSTEVKEPAPEMISDADDVPVTEDTTISTDAAEEAKRKLEEEARKKEAEMRAAAMKLVEEFNEKLQATTMYGFGNGKVKLSARQEKAWKTGNLAILKEITSKLPEGFQLEARGHADSSMAPAAKYVVITRSDASTQRAEYAKSVLVENGVSESAVKVTGKSDTEPESATNLAKNRRVTFHVIEE